MRRALTHVGGEVELGGDLEAAELLAHALDVRPSEEDEEAARPHVHGFHAYPARMHPVTAARLVAAFAPAGGGPILDPFCGSGTVLVEGMLAGDDVVGTDLNPLAVALARLKTSPLAAGEGDALLAAARAVAAHADDRRTRKAGATRRYGDADVAAFAPHVLLELDSLKDAIGSTRDEAARAALELVLSAILVKVSRKRSDTSEGSLERRIAAGYPSRLLVKKTEELVRRRAAFTELLFARVARSARNGAHGSAHDGGRDNAPGRGVRPPRARVAEDDATRLRTVAPRSIGAIVTSPPYAATYDYLEHHALRLRWLGLDARAFERGELGARRTYAQRSPEEAADAWTGELRAMLLAMANVLHEGAPVVLMVADSAVRGVPLRADEHVARAAERTLLEPIARATQPRPHFHGPTQRAFAERARAEHALLLVRRSRV